MNPDLVAQITRLVISKLEESNRGQSLSLSSAEINHWNEISTSMQKTTGNSSNGTNTNSQALSTTEIENWNEITNHMKNRNYQTTENTAQVKLYTNNY